jgi:hypothetical protein
MFTPIAYFAVEMAKQQRPADATAARRHYHPGPQTDEDGQARGRFRRIVLGLTTAAGSGARRSAHA